MKKFLATVLLACAPAIGVSQTLGSGTVNFQFTGFSGPLAASTFDNLYDSSSWIVPGLVNGVGAASLPTFFLGWSSAGSPTSDIGFVSGVLALAPTQSVSMRYASEAAGSSLENIITFTPRSFTNVAVGEDFVLGTLTFQNGGWNGGGFSASENVPSRLDFTLTTQSASGAAFNQAMSGSVTMVVHSPQNNDRNTLAGQEAEADWIYVTDNATPGSNLGAFRVFDECCRPPGAVSVGTVDLIARFNSLDLVGLSNPQGGFITTSIDPLPAVAPVPEPGAYLMMLAGILLVGAVARRRV